MKPLIAKANAVQLQWIIWTVFFLVNFLSLLPMDGAVQSLVYNLISILFYVLIVYGNIGWLLPRLYDRQHVGWYLLASIVFVCLIGVLKAWLYVFVYNRFFAMSPMAFTVKSTIYIAASCLLVYLLSFVFRIALAWFALKRQTEEMAMQKSRAELNLLKSQVQPHFLFNTLNNIYYEAYREAPRTAELIERLSGIMRYFVDESPKEDVPLLTEVQFLENYIALEKIRVRYELDITFHTSYRPETRVPPMLLMPFVENIFKHGIDKASRSNSIRLSLHEEQGFLLFRTQNLLYDHPAAGGPGLGIRNLRQRLGLLFGTGYELSTGEQGSHYIAYLKIPVQ